MGDGEDDGEPTWASIGEDRRGGAQAPTAKGSGGDAPTWASIGVDRRGGAQAPTATGSGGDAPTQPTPGDAHSPPHKERLPDVPKSGWEGGALAARAGWTPGGPGLVAAGVDLGSAAGVDLSSAGVDLSSAGLDLSSAGLDLTLA